MSDPQRCLMIRASAGSGKTFQLTNRYLRQLMEGTPAAEILATTFTRKAAGEILGRVLMRLSRAALSDDDAAQLAFELGGESYTPREFCDTLARTLRELHRLSVCTLDSFFARLATSFTLELGLPPGWEIVDEQDDQQLRAQAIADVLRDERTTDLVQLTSLLAKGQAARSVSGLVSTTVNEFYQVYGETTAEAWRQFPELHRLTNEQLEEALAALEAADLPGDSRAGAAREQDLQRARAGDWVTFIEKGLAAKVHAGETTYQRKALPENLQAAYARLLQHARAVLIHELAQQTRATHDLLVRFDLHYQRLKRESRGLRFEDITQCLRRRFAAHDEHDLAYRLDGRIEHLLLDEFQDTSPAQWLVLQPFAVRIAANEPPSSFFCVGDVKQAIYGWRGGSAEIFDSLEDQLGPLEQKPLSKSYRSAPPIMEFVNQLFLGISRHSSLREVEEQVVREWCASFPTHSTAKEDLPGYACVVSTARDETNPASEREEILPGAARRVAQIVREVPWASVGVLLRTNAEIAEMMNHLRLLGIQASEESGNPITDSAAVLTMLSLLTFADHPGDTAARFHVATSPLGERLDYLHPIDDDAATKLAADVRHRLITDGYGPTLDGWCRSLLPDVSPRDALRMGQVVELAYRFDRQPSLRPTEFVQLVEQE
ncbi:MAG: UvrD-helicase domain-containing protein, partial [Planctomycetaceae bacterium]|nr:UvrD-helicase domain-containing protein [Planctomycetaceae bacterium]